MAAANKRAGSGSGPGAEPAPSAALEHFHPATKAWFTAAFAEPTSAQAGAWNAVAAEKNALVVAPTGSGKTLAAFLAAEKTTVNVYFCNCAKSGDMGRRSGKPRDWPGRSVRNQ